MPAPPGVSLIPDTPFPSSANAAAGRSITTMHSASRTAGKLLFLIALFM